jgi:uncharacterized protein YgbK (DUF1537 family)
LKDRNLRLCIIADDLTGALDAAAPFAGRGMAVCVALSPSAIAKALTENSEILAINTCSRDLGQGMATAAVAAAIAALPSGVEIMKKIDSRLKGHITAELALFSSHSLLVAPAIPEFGRITRDGYVQGFGVTTPIDIRDRLGPLAARAIIPDVETLSQLRTALSKRKSNTLLVGARGLAEAVAIDITGKEAAVSIRTPARRSLIVVGSHDPITIAQADRVAPLLERVFAPLGEVAIASGHVDTNHLLIQATAGDEIRAPLDVARILAENVHPRLTDGRNAIVLSGGASAEAVMERMGIEVLELLGECLPGLPICRVNDTHIIAKSGGFGDDRTFCALLAMFKGQLKCHQ